MLPLSGLRLMPRKWATYSRHKTNHFNCGPNTSTITIVTCRRKPVLLENMKDEKTIAQNTETFGRYLKDIVTIIKA